MRRESEAMPVGREPVSVLEERVLGRGKGRKRGRKKGEDRIGYGEGEGRRQAA